MFNRICLLVFLGLPYFAVSASETEIAKSSPNQIIEIRLLPEKAVPGEMRRLEIDILTKKWFLNAPVYPSIQVDGAIVIAPHSFGLNFTEHRNGQDYSGQRQEYLIFPQRPGAFLIRPIKIALTVPGSDGFTAEKTSVTSAQLSFICGDFLVPPPINFNKAELLTGRQFKLKELYSETETIQVGDVLSREISLQAKDTLGMFIPSFHGNETGLSEGMASRFPGGRLYRRILDVSDNNNRGQLNANRSELWEYVFEEAGEYVLPSLRVVYWDLELQSWGSVSTEARLIIVGEPVIGNETKGGAVVSFFSLAERYSMIVLVLILLFFFVIITKKMGGFEKLSEYLSRIRKSEIVHLWILCLLSLRVRREQWQRAFFKWLAHYPVARERVKPSDTLQTSIVYFYQRAEHKQTMNASLSTFALLKALWAYRREMRKNVTSLSKLSRLNPIT